MSVTSIVECRRSSLGKQHSAHKPQKTAAGSACGGLAEMEGFEPPDGVTRQLISSQPRYDHFDTSPDVLFWPIRP